MTGIASIAKTGVWVKGGFLPHPDCDDESACRFAPLLKGEGIVLISFLWDGVVEFSNECLVLGGLGFSPLGETGEGLSSTSPRL